MNTTITPLKAWLNAATAAERELLADRVGTSSQYLSHVAVNDDKAYKREPKISLAAGIERETKVMAKASKGRLPIILRTDLVAGCRSCPYAQKALGQDIVVRSDFPIVTAGVTDSEGGHAD
jgi:hypothetical protein